MDALSNIFSSSASPAFSGGVASSAAERESLSEQASFASVLSRAGTQAGKEQSPQERARAGAEQLVATALVQPILKQLRESNQAQEPFKPNAAEKSFRGMMDAQLAQRMVTSKGWKLVDHVADSLLRKGGIPEGVSA